MTDWPVKTLGEVCEVLDSLRKPITKRDRTSGDYPYYGATGIVDYVSDYIFDERLVLVGEDGAKWDAGERTAFIAEGKYWVNNHAHVLRCKQGVLVDSWLANFLTMSDLNRYVSGLTVPKLNQGSLVSIEIPVPPLEEQKRIVELLDAATARVTELAACYEQARTHANDLFTSVLCEALEGNSDWSVKTLGDLLEVSIGGIWGSEAGDDEVDVFVYRSTELIKDGQLKEELTVRRSITARQLDSRKLEEGDLLLEKSGGGPKTPVGRVGLVKILPGLSVCSNFMQLMRPRKNDVLPVYLHYFLNHFHVAGHTEDLQNNSTNIRNLKTTEYMNVEIPLPPLVEQKNIVARMDSMRAKTSEMVAAYDAKLTAAKNLRQSILEAAFAGEL